MKKQLLPIKYIQFIRLFSVIVLMSVSSAMLLSYSTLRQIKPLYTSGDSLAIPTKVFSCEENERLSIMSMVSSISGLSNEIVDYALNGFNYMKSKGIIKNTNIITIADFSQPSWKKRLYVIDLVKGKLLFNTFVAHGVNSGLDYAKDFSNKPESFKSSPGFYVTSNTYNGNNGYSLKLKGIEKGINDNAEERDIVVHGAAYVHENFIKMKGYIGRSFGCPSVPEKLSKPIINTIKNGTCLFIYSPNKNYIASSRILHPKTVM